MVLQQSQRFCRFTGMKINAPKSGVWATSRSLRAQLATTCVVNGVPVPLVMDERHLGAFVSFTKRKCRGRIDHTQKACDEILERISGLKLHLEARAHLVSALVLPKALYGAGVACPSNRSMTSLRAKCARAVWGQGNRWRAVEAVFSPLTKGHIADPVHTPVYSPVKSHATARLTHSATHHFGQVAPPHAAGRVSRPSFPSSAQKSRRHLQIPQICIVN